MKGRQTAKRPHGGLKKNKRQARTVNANGVGGELDAWRE